MAPAIVKNQRGKIIKSSYFFVVIISCVFEYFFFPLILNYSVRSLYSHTNSYNDAVTLCHVDGSQRSLAYL